MGLEALLRRFGNALSMQDKNLFAGHAVRQTPDRVKRPEHSQ